MYYEFDPSINESSQYEEFYSWFNVSYIGSGESAIRIKLNTMLKYWNWLEYNERIKTWKKENP